MLFDFDTDNYITLNKNNDFNFNFMNYLAKDSQGISNKLFDPEEGFLRGNMFRELYDEYKEYRPKALKLNSERERLLFNVNKYDFAINDINLYLDLYPTDQEIFSLFKKYVIEYKKAKEEYEKSFGPLCLTSTLGENYTWVNNPWPWDNTGGTKYV